MAMSSEASANFGISHRELLGDENIFYAIDGDEKAGDKGEEDIVSQSFGFYNGS